MKTKALVLAAALIAGMAAQAAEPASASTADRRVGVYDSRIVAFAHFWSEPAQTRRNALFAEATAAKQAGDAAKVTALGQQIKAEQERIHLEIFSTAPADEAMAALQEKLPALRRELGVARLVSQWDTAALQDIPAADRIDATDRLAAEFSPNDKRLKTIAQMKKVVPLARDEAEKLMKAGKL